MKKQKSGAIYENGGVTFRVFAPYATEVKLCLYRFGTGGEPYLVETMLREGDYFTRSFPGRPADVYYTYLIDGVETIDPYAKAGGLNGERGMVLDFAETNPIGWENDRFTPVAPIIWELHVRDFSSDPSLPIENHGKYTAFLNGVTTKNGYSALVDYIRELGVTYVHLLPCADFGSVDEADPDYNWGYDPQNYFFPEGSYSTDPADGKVRVYEFKKMVQTLHANGIGVILDVVFNHTFRTKEYAFEKTAPGVFYRMKDGAFTNGSGCGNELATERDTVRQLIIESVLWWLKEYHIDGFRFDLMGLIDVETMNLVRKAVDGAYADGRGKDVLLYGEPWGGFGTTGANVPLADLAHVELLDERIAVFNPILRDGIRGFESFGYAEGGIVQGNLAVIDKVRCGVEGELCAKKYSRDYFEISRPDRQICYAACHDGLTLYDHCVAILGDNGDAVLAHKMADFIVLGSLGIPFLQAGEEFCRTKTGNANSYNSSDSVNMLDWSRREQYDSVVQYVKGLIACRKQNKVFDRLSTAAECFAWQTVENPDVICYTVGDYLYAVNPTENEAVINGALLTEGVLLADIDFADPNSKTAVAFPYRLPAKNVALVKLKQ